MKKMLIILAMLSFASCATVKPILETTDKAVSEVRSEYTDAEWALFYSMASDIFRKGEEVALTNFGEKLFAGLADITEQRSKSFGE